MDQSVRIAAGCCQSQPGEAGRNLDQIDRIAREAANEGATLLVLPELSVTGFIPNHPVGDHQAWLQKALLFARAHAEPMAGYSAARLCQIAKTHQLLVAAGILEDAGNLLYNTYLLAGPDGVVAHWRKLHIPMFEMPFYQPGTPPVVVDAAMALIGANICFDAFMPESTRLLAIQNVELVLFPFAANPGNGSEDDWCDWATVPLRSRCAENGVFGVASNYLGHVKCAGAEQTFPGGDPHCRP